MDDSNDKEEEEDFPGRLLHQAALWDNSELLEDLLRGDHLSKIDSRDGWGRTALHAASTTENSVCLRILLQSGANVNVICGARGDNRSALHVCAEYGFVNNASLLLSYKANLIAKDSNGLTAFDIAENKGHAKCARLLKHAADAFEESRRAIHSELRDGILASDTLLVKSLVKQLGQDAQAIINITPNGSNTLLFSACEIGSEEIVKMLLDAGADGRIHPVTRYSPLYIACFKGHKKVITLLLKRLPELVKEHTVERWLPLHAACINGHVSVVEMLITYPYAKHLLETFTKDEWEYEMPFDVNMKDVSGQNVIYMACLLDHIPMINLLLNFKVNATKLRNKEEISKEENTLELENGTLTSVQKRSISYGIQRIMSKLNVNISKGGGTKQIDLNDNNNNNMMIIPWRVNDYCNNNTETPLHVAVRQRSFDIVTLLLNNGANTNLPIRNVDRQMENENDNGGEMITALVLACNNRDVALVQLLIKHGATDHHSRALSIAINNQDDILITKLLAIKAYADPENRINKQAMNSKITKLINNREGVGREMNITYNGVFPSVPVMINWHAHSNESKLKYIKHQWLMDGAFNVNRKLSVNNEEGALVAITRIDISNNALTSLPSSIFYLPSLRYLNVAENKIECLPDLNDNRNKYKYKYKHEYEYEYAATLQEVYLQDNRLEFVPDWLFTLPSLVTLDLSNNKLQTVPTKMWSAPKLSQLNLSFNLLSNLPLIIEQSNQLNKENNTNTSAIESHEYENNTMNTDKKDMSSHQHQMMNKRKLELVHENLWMRNIRLCERGEEGEGEKDNETEKQHHLSMLNLAHNQFTSVPRMLACLAPNLTRLNISYNRLSDMGDITCYPCSVKQLDLSHNEITEWPTINTNANININMQCYQPNNDAIINITSNDKKTNTGRMSNNNNNNNNGWSSSCWHRKHTRLDNLRTLIVAHNKLTTIQLLIPNYHHHHQLQESNNELLLMFGNVTMLDISNNELKSISSNIHLLSNLSVLNIAGNNDICELPAEMGLLSRLWNLNTRGCNNLQEPLKGMLNSNKYKTMDVIGYLKSIFEEAKPYRRMKLMIVGVEGIGKTSLLQQLRQYGHTSNYKKEHWAKRMGNKNTKTNKGNNMSTVGVDIADWIYENKQKSNGPITFRTWDFGGQREYYATHQYFLSKRSLYLVVWKMTDGQDGLNQVMQWLVNIQARAANSPVIIVGTHYDVMIHQQPSQSQWDIQQLQNIIKTRFVNVIDCEKRGLPRVVDSIEVSCKSKYNIKLLCNRIYDIACTLRLPGNKQVLLEERVPSFYIALEEVVNHIAMQRKSNNMEPVLKHDEYKTLVHQHMMKRYNRTFRDNSELRQATLFLHDNGVLLHYEDATLKNLYFLDPQWLCDLLAHVVTIREINPFAPSGIMKMDNLQHVFKSSNLITTLQDKEYIVNLLNKFEVALSWDTRTLLIPSLLPVDNNNNNNNDNTSPGVTIPVRYRASSSTTRCNINSPPILSERFQVKTDADADGCIRRLLAMSYFPCGFWPRLITRILADDAVPLMAHHFFITSNHTALDNSEINKLLDVKAAWVVWQTRIELRCFDMTLMRLHQVNKTNSLYQNTKLMVKQEGNVWSQFDMDDCCFLEIVLPLDTLVIKEQEDVIGYRTHLFEPNIQTSCKLLVLLVDHIDLLLEDWYPTIGTRFVHTSEGRFLVSRLIPCPTCIACLNNQSSSNIQQHTWRQWKSSEDSGVGSPSNSESMDNKKDDENSNSDNDNVIYSWTMEQCILASYDNKYVTCAVHCNMSLAQVAPDTMFMDLPTSYIINDKHIIRGKLLGRGAFGFVFSATYNNNEKVAMKMLQPVEPVNSQATDSAIIAYKDAKAKWSRDALQYSSKAYWTARQELSILINVQHANIVPFKGVCRRPLAIVLELAPMGSLRHNLNNYRTTGTKLHANSIQLITLQVAKAIEYLHEIHIIYRDLKSENILVWSMPGPFQCLADTGLHIKLADYGISRLTLPYGAKGFAGTEGFMAPEIMRYNGEEEYTDKVDCYSFGMFMYELFTLHQPFEKHESVKEFVLEGGRPALSPTDTLYASYMLDLMVCCWSQSPSDRPSASQIVSIVSAPEFTHLRDVISLPSSVISLLPSLNVNEDVQDHHNMEDDVYECLWLLYSNNFLDTLTIGKEESFVEYCSVPILEHNNNNNVLTTDIITCMLFIDANTIWFGDEHAQLHIYTYNNNNTNNNCKQNIIEKVLKYPLLLQENTITSTTTTTAISQMLLLAPIDRVAITLTNGRILIVSMSMSIMTELQCPTNLNSLAATFKRDALICELWCGHDGQLSIYTIKDDTVLSHQLINAHLDDAQMALSYHVTLVSSYEKDDNQIWSYLSPGCTVFAWDTSTKMIVNKLDCSKLVPCSETMESISIEESSNPQHTQISSVGIIQEQLYIGTNWGCIIVAEKASMIPITVFRPYEQQVSTIECLMIGQRAIIITIGFGYRSLISRYTNNHVYCNSKHTNSNTNSSNVFAILWSTETWF